MAYRAAQGRPIDPAGASQARPGAEDLRRQAIEAWRSLRAKEGESRGGEITADRDRDAGRDSAPQQRGGERGQDHSL